MASVEGSKTMQAVGALKKNSASENRAKYRIFPWLAVLLTLLAYRSVVDNQFVNWDDPPYIQYNVHIRDLSFSSIQWMFANFHAGFWIPLTWLSLALDFGLGRLEPWVYHLDNLLLHCLNTALVFFLSHKFLILAWNSMGGQNLKNRSSVWLAPSAFGAAVLFGLHPIHVESVAWATERKDLLCGLFFLLGLWLYLDYAAHSVKVGWKYGACLGFFLLSLLAKPMSISFPFVLLLLDFWPLGRFRFKPSNVLLEKIPFFVGALLSSGIAVRSEFQAGAGWGLDQSPLSFRVMNACHSLVFYLGKMLFPVKLAAFYPIFVEKVFSAEYLLSALLVLLISFTCFTQRRKRPYLAVAWLYYGLTLAPVLGIVQVGNQAAADRFTYLPSLGPFLILAAVFVNFLWDKRIILVLLAVGWAGLLSYGTLRQVSIWKNSAVLWENTLKFYPGNNLIVHQNLGQAYEEAGRWNEALAKYDDAINPSFPFLYPLWGKGRVLSKKGFWDESIREFEKALAMNPGFPPLHSDLGMVYERKGAHSKALKEAREGVRIDPFFAEGYHNLGLLLRNGGRWEEAIGAFERAKNLDPENPVYLRSLLAAYRKTGRHREAMVLYQELSRRPRSLLTLNF